MDNFSEVKEKVEDFLSSKKSSTKITNIVLGVIFVCGVVTIAATAPNVFQIFGKRYKKINKYNKRQIQNNLQYLKQKKMISFVRESDDKITVKITKNGYKKIVQYSIDELEIKKPKKWDKKWRIVTFDIPDKNKKARDALRRKLKDLGFYQFQKSVWIYPYECSDEIMFVVKIFNIERFVEILTVTEIIREDKYIEYFNLH